MATKLAESKDDAGRVLATMWTIRRFEEAVAALIQERDRLLTGHKRVTTGDVDAHD